MNLELLHETPLFIAYLRKGSCRMLKLVSVFTNQEHSCPYTAHKQSFPILIRIIMRMVHGGYIAHAVVERRAGNRMNLHSNPDNDRLPKCV